MKKYFLFLIAFSFLAGCRNDAVEKPDNLIPKEMMAHVIYDLSVLQAMKNSNQAVLDSNNVDPTKYIYKKYKIDSLQFAKSNQFYASDIKEYDKLYQRVNERLIQEKKLADTLAKKEEVKLKKEIIKAKANSDSLKPKSKKGRIKLVPEA